MGKQVRRLNMEHAQPREALIRTARSLTAADPLPPLPDDSATPAETSGAPADTGDAKPYKPQPYKADPDELVICPQCSSGNDSDATYCDQCGFDLTSTGFQPAPYSEKPDEDVICPQCSKHDDDDASYCDQCGFKLAGATGVVVESDSGEGGTSPGEPTATTSATGRATAALADAQPGLQNPTNPPTDIVDDQGNVAPDAVCANQNCGHFASGHADVPAGDNAGPCQMENCDCQGFTVDDSTGTPTDPEGDDADSSGDVPAGGPDNAGGSDLARRAALADVPVTAPATDAPEPGASALDLPELAPDGTNPPPVIEPGENVGPAFYAVVAIEGQQTGDDRGIMADALEFGEGLPLMGLATEAHDPSGFDPNLPAVWCGRIDTVERVPGANGTNLLVATGHFFSNADGLYFADLVEQMGSAGVSADIGVTESVETITGMDEWGWPLYASYVSKGVLLGATIVPFPAFTDCYITLGDGPVEPTPVQAENQPEPVVASVRPHFMDLTTCAPCAKAAASTIAASAAPVRPPAEWFANPNFTVGDGRLREIYAGRGDRRIGGQYAAPLTITEAGEVFGHIAPWGVCHTGIQNACQTAPHSPSDYAHFKRGNQVVICDDGSQVNVGTLTFNGGHADLRAGAASAMAHYDDTATAWAHVAIGEDDFGIWVHGAVLPDVSEEDLRRIRASSPSGDWRMIGGHYELVGVQSVNQPGFPVSIAASDRGALVAAGAYVMADPSAFEAEIEPTSEPVRDEGLRKFFQPLIDQRRAELTRRYSESRREAARLRLAAIKRRYQAGR